MSQRKHELREIFNGLHYLVKTGMHWRMLPHDLPPWQTAYYYFRSWRNAGTWERIYSAIRTQARPF